MYNRRGPPKGFFIFLFGCILYYVYLIFYAISIMRNLMLGAVAVVIVMVVGGVAVILTALGGMEGRLNNQCYEIPVDNGNVCYTRTICPKE